MPSIYYSSCPQLPFSSLFDNFSYNIEHTCTCQRSAIEIYKRVKSQDLLIDTFFFREINKNEKDFIQRFIMGKSDIFLPFGNSLDYFNNLSTFIIWVIILLFEKQNHLQPKKLEGAFQKMNLGIFSNY